jgi:hypothetical protein
MRPSRKLKRINKTYHIINTILAGIILMVFIYSGLFSAGNKESNHPIPSFYENLTGEPAPSSGLSRAFSEIVRGNLESARNYNPDSLLIFSFFLIQFVQRILVSILLFKQTVRFRALLTADVTISILLFLYCFKGQLLAMAGQVWS